MTKETVTEVHAEKLTLSVAVFIPGHAARTTTALFLHSKERLVQRDGDRCFICQRTSAEAGPLEAHHNPIERSFAEMIDWSAGSLIRKDFPNFDWVKFDSVTPMDPYLFVDDMLVNGKMICKDHHIGADEGIHTLPYPIWIAQRYGAEGYKFSDKEILHHDILPEAHK